MIPALAAAGRNTNIAAEDDAERNCSVHVSIFVVEVEPRRMNQKIQTLVIWFTVTVLHLVGFQCSSLGQSVSDNQTARANIAAFVQPLPAAMWSKSPKNSRTRTLLRDYHDSLLRWDEILLKRKRPVAGKTGCVFYGEGGHGENDIRPITYAALVNAFLAEVQPSFGEVSRARRERMRSDAMGALNYLVQGHVTGHGSCVNGKQWGNQWQSAMWTRSAGLAGWIVWQHLSEELKNDVARMVEFEANRFLVEKPKSSEFKDTGAEENAWNAQILSLAYNMMPRHPHAIEWSRAAKLWMYNSLSAAADANDSSTGDDSRPLSDWVHTVNVHPDFTLENHGIVHVGYLETSTSLLLENALPYLLVGAPVPQACRHHAADCFEVFLRCLGWDASPVYFSGNDWKQVHTQPTDGMQYAFMSLLAGDRNAARLERLALDYTKRIQKSENGYFNERRDIEYGGLVAARMIAVYLAHAILGAGAKPASETEFNRHIAGVQLFKDGKVIVHRTPTKFASFSWGHNRMGLALPENGNWVLWPHFASYIGQINSVDASERAATLKSVRHAIRPDGFSVMGDLQRFHGQVAQSFFYTSLAGDVTVYVERLRASPEFAVQTRETGIVGLEYDLGRNVRQLYSSQGKLNTVGVGGEKARVVSLKTDWLNIDDRVGYVVRRLPRRENVMRFHDEVAGSGRVPKLQEWISLIGESDAASSGNSDWACLVTFLNQKRLNTASWARRITFTVDGERAICRIGSEEVLVDLSSLHPQ